MSDSSLDSLAAVLAPAIHEYYRAQAKKEGWTMKYDVPFAELPNDLQHANIEAARRIPTVLGVAGLQIAPESDPSILAIAEAKGRIENNIEAVAIAEHKGWMQEKLDSGWQFGPTRDDAKKIHPSITPYEDLSEEEKEKDRSAVRNYPEMVRLAGLGVGLRVGRKE